MKTKLYPSIILIGLFFSVCEIVNAQAPNWLWGKAFGGTDFDYSDAIVVDASGNVYTTGEFIGTVDFDPGAGTSNLSSSGFQDIFISKTDASGNFVWAKQIGGTSAYGEGWAIALDPSGNGDICITGYFGGTADFDPGAGVFNLTSTGGTNTFITKLNSSGNFIWAKAMGHGYGFSIAVDPSGSKDVYTTGTFQGTADFDPGTGTFNLTSAGNSDIFISKLDSSGNFEWAKAIGNISSDWGWSIAVDPSGSGDIYTTGRFESIVDFDPDAGTFNLTSAGSSDIFISKLDASGNFVWAKAMGSTGSDIGYSIAIDPAGSGSVYTTGFFHDTADFDPGAGVFNLSAVDSNDIFISKLDASGNFIWAKAMGGASNDYAVSLTLDPSGNGDVYTTGSFNGTADFDPGAGTFNLTSAGTFDVFISKLDDSGNFIWANSMGGTSSDEGTSIAVDTSGSAYITGVFTSPSISIGPTTIVNTDTTGNNNDIFIAKLDVLSGIENIQYDNGISIYPNPVSDVLSVSINHHLPVNSLITINDMQGRVVGEKNTNHTYGSNSSVIPINVSALSQGVYLLRMDGVMRRFVKM